MVGTLLYTVNQGQVIVGAAATGLTWVQVVFGNVAFNYALRHVVAGVGYLSARRVRPDRPPN